MKDESKNRFSKLRSRLGGQDESYREDSYYQDEVETYDEAQPEENDTFREYDDAPDFNTGYEKMNYSSASRTSSYSSSNLGNSSSGGHNFGGYSTEKSSGNIHRMTSKQSRLSILRLEKLDDAVKVADEIMTGNTITLIDLRSVSKESVRRIIDFLDGVRYTCGARLEIVADFTYVLVPKDVEVSGDLFDNQFDTNGLS